MDMLIATFSKLPSCTANNTMSACCKTVVNNAVVNTEVYSQAAIEITWHPSVRLSVISLKIFFHVN